MVSSEWYPGPTTHPSPLTPHPSPLTPHPSFGIGRRKQYKHRDLGFVVDLGGFQAAANPLHIPITGRPAHTVARGYHLFSMPGNRARIALDWALDVALPRQTAQLGLVRSPAVPLDTASPEVPQHHLGFPHARTLRDT